MPLKDKIEPVLDAFKTDGDHGESINLRNEHGPPLDEDFQDTTNYSSNGILALEPQDNVMEDIGKVCLIGSSTGDKLQLSKEEPSMTIEDITERTIETDILQNPTVEFSQQYEDSPDPAEVSLDI